MSASKKSMSGTSQKCSQEDFLARGLHTIISFHFFSRQPLIIYCFFAFFFLLFFWPSSAYFAYFAYFAFFALCGLSLVCASKRPNHMVAEDASMATFSTTPHAQRCMILKPKVGCGRASISAFCYFLPPRNPGLTVGELSLLAFPLRFVSPIIICKLRPRGATPILFGMVIGLHAAALRYLR